MFVKGWLSYILNLQLDNNCHKEYKLIISYMSDKEVNKESAVIVKEGAAKEVTKSTIKQPLRNPPPMNYGKNSSSMKSSMKTMRPFKHKSS